MPAATTNLQTQKMELKGCEKLLLVAGPSWKRRICTSSDSETETKDQKRSKMRGQHSPVMKPRRLFKACETQHHRYSRHHLWILHLGNFSKRTCGGKVHLRTLFFFPDLFLVTEVTAGTKVTQVLSSSRTSSGQWEAELDGDADMSECLDTPEVAAKGSDLCQQFSSEMSKKFEVRARTSIERVTVACECTQTRINFSVMEHARLNCALRGCKSIAKSRLCAWWNVRFYLYSVFFRDDKPVALCEPRCAHSPSEPL